MSTQTLIRGAGGGGKSGGGSSHVPTEQPDSLRSRQFARVLDLVSEGEIGGLVNGLKSIYLDDTPIQNADGTSNFTGVTMVNNTGTQAQAALAGFNEAEAETPVSTEVKASASVTRTISNTNTNAARVTLSFPQMTNQNTSTGDLGGTSVEIAIDVQNNGGGFVAQNLRRVMDSSKFSVASPGGIMQVTSSRVTVDVTWTGADPIVILGQVQNPLQSAAMQLQYRPVSGGAWTTIATYTFSGQATASNLFGTTTYSAPTETKTFDLTVSSATRYEFQTVSAGTITGGSVEVGSATDVISGKCTSRYQRAYRLNLPSPGPWDIRVRRITADSVAVNIADKTFWDSYTEIVHSKLRYPNSALVGLEVDSEQFRNIPARSYDCKGMLIQIPDNYDPLLRTYSGTWSGAFVTAWSDNPAWVFYDMVTNDRYGLGEFIAADQVDKWALYEIGQYCDELVDDGFGSKEPRFTCFLYLQTQEEAFKVLANLASIFRGFTYWAGGSIVPVQDAPSDPVALFTAANVVEGAFSYSGSALRTRHTVALVSWNDPSDAYRQKIEYVADETGIARYGVQQTDVAAIGCKSRGQAHRMGRAILYTERMETETVSFRTGLVDTTLFPGGIIQTQDAVRSGKRFGGRVQSATTTAITLDAAVTIESGKTYELSCVLSDGAVETKAVTNAAGSATVLTLATALSSAPQTQSVWVLTASDLVPESWRVLAVTEVDKTQAEIIAVSYRSDKHAAIEQNLVLEPLLTSSINTDAPAAPPNLTVNETLYLAGLGTVGVKATVGWDAVPLASYYILEYVITNGNIVTLTTTSNTVDIQPIAEGVYTFSVSAVNIIGRRSASYSISKIIYGKATPPADVQNLQLAAISGAAHITFTPSADLDVQVGGNLRIKHTTLLSGATWSAGVDIGPAIPGTASSAVLPLLSGTYLAKWVDSSGNESTNAVSIITTAPNITDMNVVTTVAENPTWTGTKTSLIYDGTLGGIKLDSAVLIDGITDLIDSWGFVDSLGGMASSGEYVSATTTDLGAKMPCRISATLLASAFDADDMIDSRALVDDWADVDGGTVSDAFAQVYIRTTNDNPAGSPVWSAWQPFYVGDYDARAFQFKAVLTSQYATHNVLVTGMSVTIDMPDRVESGADIISGAATKTVTYSVPFKAVTGRSVTAENMQTGDFYQITSETTAGFDITFKNSAGTNVSRTFDYTTIGYGNG